MSYIYAFIIKRDGEILIKGLSFDKTSWFLMPKELRPLRLHTELTKYIKERELLVCRKVGRSAQVRLTKAIKGTYCKNNEFAIDGKMLPKDDNLKQDSIVNALIEVDRISSESEKGDL